MVFDLTPQLPYLHGSKEREIGKCHCRRSLSGPAAGGRCRARLRCGPAAPSGVPAAGAPGRPCPPRGAPFADSFAGTWFAHKRSKMRAAAQPYSPSAQERPGSLVRCLSSAGSRSELQPWCLAAGVPRLQARAGGTASPSRPQHQPGLPKTGAELQAPCYTRSARPCPPCCAVLPHRLPTCCGGACGGWPGLRASIGWYT